VSVNKFACALCYLCGSLCSLHFLRSLFLFIETPSTRRKRRSPRIYKRFLCVLCHLGVLFSYLFFYLRDGLAVGIGVILQDELPGQAFGDIDDDGAKEIRGDFNASFLLIPVDDIDDR